MTKKFTNWIHWSSDWKHPDGREITCEGDYKEGEFNHQRIDMVVRLTTAGFEEVNRVENT